MLVAVLVRGYDNGVGRSIGCSYGACPMPYCKITILGKLVMTMVELVEECLQHMVVLKKTVT